MVFSQKTQPNSDLVEEFHYYFQQRSVSRHQTLRDFFTDHKDFPVDYPSPEGFTALHLAVYDNNIDMMDFLLRRGANPYIKFKTKYPITRIASDDFRQFNTPPIDSLDILAMAVLQYDSEKDTSFIYSVWEKMGKPRDWSDNQGNTLLHVAMFGRWANTALLNFLSRTFSINPNRTNLNGQTAITYCLSFPPQRQYADAYILDASSRLELAVRVGMNIELRDNYGKNYRDYLKQYNQETEIAQFDSFQEYKKVLEIQRKFAEADHEAMRKRTTEAAEKYRVEYEEYLKRQKERRRSGGCNERCDACFGFGSGKERAVRGPCSACNGRGDSGYSKSVIDGYQKTYTFYSRNVCWKCNGSGSGIYYEPQPCSVCKGSGCLDKE
ncbi:MAG: hypothetical protein NZ108_06920 [Bacteroidia bacterium]|nr:hypothetical protein [Bacteroidia bacterium]